MQQQPPRPGFPSFPPGGANFPAAPGGGAPPRPGFPPSGFPAGGNAGGFPNAPPGGGYPAAASGYSAPPAQGFPARGPVAGVPGAPGAPPGSWGGPPAPVGVAPAASGPAPPNNWGAPPGPSGANGFPPRAPFGAAPAAAQPPFAPPPSLQAQQPFQPPRSFAAPPFPPQAGGMAGPPRGPFGPPSTGVPPQQQSMPPPQSFSGSSMVSGGSSFAPPGGPPVSSAPFAPPVGGGGPFGAPAPPGMAAPPFGNAAPPEGLQQPPQAALGGGAPSAFGAPFGGPRGGPPGSGPPAGFGAFPQQTQPAPPAMGMPAAAGPFGFAQGGGNGGSAFPNAANMGGGGPSNIGGAPFGQQQVGGAFTQQQHAAPSFSAPAVAQAPMAEIDPSLQANPWHMNMTLGAVPRDVALMSKSALPLGVVCHPLASGPPLPIVSFGASGVVRCKKCRAYINPFVRFIDAGRRWRCNFCIYVNDVQPDYFSPCDENGRRADEKDRPELTRGSVEFIAPVEYMVRPPQAPAYVFVLDVSYSAVSSGVFATACATIRRALPFLPGGDRTLIGFITHDTSVHFYKIPRPDASGTPKVPSVLVVSDIDDIFTPVPEDLLVNLSETRQSVERLLDSLPAMYAGNRTMDSALGPALDAAYQISQHVGGKVVVVQACLPTLGGGKLKPREGPRMLGGEKEHTLFAPDGSEDGVLYKTKAVEFSKQQLSVDFFLFNPHYSDVATLGSLSRYTAGQVYWYGPAYSPASDGARFSADLERNLTRPTGFEAVMRVRATKGVSITNFYGNFFIRGTDLLALPNVTCDTAFNVELALDTADPLAPGSVVSVQAALLYTTSSGERRITVHTLARPVTSFLADLFRKVDCDTVVNCMAKIALDNTLRHGLVAARRYLHNTLVEIMRAYKASQSSGGAGSHGGLAASSGSLSRLPMGSTGGPPGSGGPPGPGAPAAPSLPDCLALLPLYSMGLQKSLSYRGGDVIRSDERSYLAYRMLSMPCIETRPFVYPRLFSLHDMESAAGMPDPEQGDIAAPNPHAGPRVRLPALASSVSASALSPSGAYLLDSGIEMFLWLGRDVPAGLVNALFGEQGVPSGQGSDPAAALERPQENLFAKRIAAIVRTLRAAAVSTQRLRVVQEGSNDVNEIRFQWHLVEDRQNYSGGSCTYEEYVAIASKEAQMPTMGVQMGGGSN